MSILLIRFVIRFCDTKMLFTSGIVVLKYMFMYLSHAYGLSFIRESYELVANGKIYNRTEVSMNKFFIPLDVLADMSCGLYI